MRMVASVPIGQGTKHDSQNAARCVSGYYAAKSNEGETDVASDTCLKAGQGLNGQHECMYQSSGYKPPSILGVEWLGSRKH